MRFLFVTGDEHLPDNEGGARRTAHYLCLGLQAKGHVVQMLAATLPGDEETRRGPGRYRITRSGSRDSTLGYPVVRRTKPWNAIPDVIAEFGPSVAIVQTGSRFEMAWSCVEAGTPTIIYLNDVEMNELFRRNAGPRYFKLNHPLIRYVANSNFTAERYRGLFGIELLVIPPLVPPEIYQTPSRRECAVFVNPAEIKGLDVALRLARARPDIPFEFVLSWGIKGAEIATLRDKVRSLPNVALRERTEDMRDVYAGARVLLVPSRWDEAWGRVVSEAHVSGIPALASRRGGLPESVGPGGILVDPDAGPAHWLAALSRLWDDTENYDRLVRSAIEHSERPEMQPESILRRFEAVAREIARDIPDQAHETRPALDRIGLSVVVATHNRPDGLDRLLRSLRPQIAFHPARELIVVNDGTHDEAYAQVIDRHRDFVRYIALTRNIGPSHARNVGAAAAKNKILVFTDDDCAAPPYWLDWLCALTLQHPDAEVIGGTTRPLAPARQTLFSSFLAHAGFYPRPHLIDGRANTLVTANLAVRRIAFVEVGGFDETLMTGEDHNLTYKLWRRRSVIHCDQNWFVDHDMTSTVRRHFRRYFEYGIGIHRCALLERQGWNNAYMPEGRQGPRYWLWRWRRHIRGARALFAHSTLNRRTQRLFRWLSIATWLAMDLGYLRAARAYAKAESPRSAWRKRLFR
ncbi:MAG TPA: glycosyltransferase [Candidatus Cybelea sp.]|nr:glycosyltransferase [Candidatus Cybelea sp.]